MKIRSVEPLELAAPAGEPSSPWGSTILLVKVTTADGAVGWGEAPTTLMTHPVRESVADGRAATSANLALTRYAEAA